MIQLLIGFNVTWWLLMVLSKRPAVRARVGDWVNDSIWGGGGLDRALAGVSPADEIWERLRGRVAG